MQRLSAGSEPALSVLLPYRDARATLAEALDSILAQRRAAFELIAIDDGSRDDGAQLVHALAARDPRIVALRSEGVGIARALNLGLGVARSPLIARSVACHRAQPQSMPAPLSVPLPSNLPLRLPATLDPCLLPLHLNVPVPVPFERHERQRREAQQLHCDIRQLHDHALNTPSRSAPDRQPRVPACRPAGPRCPRSRSATSPGTGERMMPALACRIRRERSP